MTATTSTPPPGAAAAHTPHAFGTVVETPWGPSSRLRSRRLPPGPGTPRSAVADNQRERLMGATIAVVAERGYEATRVADVIDLAGVSRAAFYRQFANKHECFMATLDYLLERARSVLADARGMTAESPRERLETVLETILALAAQQPAAAWLCLVEVRAAGGEAAARTARAGEDFVAFFTDEVERIGPDAVPPQSLTRAILGGVRHVIHTHVVEGREDELPGLTGDLLAWALGYGAPPHPLRQPRKPPPVPDVPSDPSAQRARILTAVTEAVAEKGFQDVTITDIAARAAVSLSTFYAHFEGKPDALVAALDDRERRLRELTVPVHDAAPDWPRAVEGTLRRVIAFMASDPVTARIGGIAAYGGGPPARSRVELSMERFQELLTPGYDEHPDANPLAAEAACGAIATFLYERLHSSGSAQVYAAAPAATYLALAPFVGRERACAIANSV